MAQEVMPAHVAIVPDGNRRWSKLHRLPALEGHRRGAESMHNVIDLLIGRVKYLTLWGFSADNWKRSEDEVRDLFSLLAAWIEEDAPWLNSRDVRLRHIGRIGELPDFLQRAINQAIELTRRNTGMTLALAFNYGGRTEIVDAVRRLIDSGRLDEPAMSRPQLDEKLFRHYLYTNGMPDVDLLIRTGGDFRISNFLLWQTAYSEFYFTKVLWPDFSTVELDMAFQEYSQRKRRFGGD